jgi:phage-related protein (TIGR01555 family)
MSYYTTVRDTLKNFVTGLGTPGLDPSRSVQYDFTLLDRNQLENMYRGDWLARKICDAPAEDVTREWRAWQASQSQIEALETIEKTMDLQRKVKQWITRARLYGGAALIVGVDDGNDPSQPLNLEKCGRGCLKYVVVLNRYELNAGPRQAPRRLRLRRRRHRRREGSATLSRLDDSRGSSCRRSRPSASA